MLQRDIGGRDEAEISGRVDELWLTYDGGSATRAASCSTDGGGDAVGEDDVDSAPTLVLASCVRVVANCKNDRSRMRKGSRTAWKDDDPDLVGDGLKWGEGTEVDSVIVNQSLAPAGTPPEPSGGPRAGLPEVPARSDLGLACGCRPPPMPPAPGEVTPNLVDGLGMCPGGHGSVVQCNARRRLAGVVSR